MGYAATSYGYCEHTPQTHQNTLYALSPLFMVLGTALDLQSHAECPGCLKMRPP